MVCFEISNSQSNKRPCFFYVVIRLAGLIKSVYWKNGQMITLTNGDFPARAYSIAIQGNDVYVYGTQGNSQLNQSAKYWKNGFAIELTDGTKESVALDIAVNKGDVYVCGMESSSAYPGPVQTIRQKSGKTNNLQSYEIRQ
jgi:hypothetical protein